MAARERPEEVFEEIVAAMYRHFDFGPGPDGGRVCAQWFVGEFCMKQPSLVDPTMRALAERYYEAYRYYSCDR